MQAWMASADRKRRRWRAWGKLVAYEMVARWQSDYQRHENESADSSYEDSTHSHYLQINDEYYIPSIRTRFCVV